MPASFLSSLGVAVLLLFAQSVAYPDSAGLEDVVTPAMLEAEADARLDWSAFGKHDQNSTIAVDASAYSGIIEQYGDHGPQAAIDFLHLSKRGLGALAAYVAALQKVPVSTLNRNEQLAFWLNLHNAQGILQTANEYPLQDDNSKVVILGPAWTEPSLTVEGHTLSLRDIERRILLRQWPDPLVLYGMYLPASGAPPAATEPFRGADVWRRLEERARQFVNHGPSHQFIRDELHVSAFYFLADTLLGEDAAMLAHLRRYAEPDLATRLSGFTSIKANWLNWRLNSFNGGYDVNQDRAGGGS